MDYIAATVILVLSLSSIQPASSISPALILTSYIKENKTLEARSLSAVKPALFLNRTSHSGFLTVDQRYNSNTFFWYFPVEDKPVENTPLIIWLQGGPGSSSLIGVFEEIGPFEYVNKELRGRKYAWTNEYSVLFLDNPIGAGYSFTDNDLGFARNMTTYANHLYSALQQFLTVFPELRKAPLFLAGESYAGRYVPALALRILEEGKPADDWLINLQGLIMGNPVMNREDVGNYTDVYYHWGLLDAQGVLAAKPLENQYWQAVQQGNFQMASILRDQLLDKLVDIALQQNTFNVLVDEYKMQAFEEFLSGEAVRDALHVGPIKFTYNNQTAKNMLVADFLINVQPKVEKLLDKYKILIYCGQLDLTSPCVPNAEARRKKWRWSKRDEFLNAPRAPWWYNDTVAGYVKSGGNLMEALVRRAGHLVPIDKPAEALKLVSSFIKDVDVDLPPNFSPSNDTHVTYHPDETVYVTPSVGGNEPKDPHKVTNDKITSNKTETNDNKPGTTGNKTGTNGNETEINGNKVETNGNKTENGNKTGNTPTASPVSVTKSESGVSAGTIVSIILNVILVLVVVFGTFFYIRLKRRNEDFLYNNIESNSEDLFLT